MVIGRTWVWIAAACVAVLVARSLRAEPLAPDRPSTGLVIRVVATAPPNGQFDDERAAVEALQAIVDRRPELVEAFSGSGQLDVGALLKWSTSDNDSDSVLLTPQRHVLQRIAARLQAANDPPSVQGVAP